VPFDSVDRFASLATDTAVVLAMPCVPPNADIGLVLNERVIPHLPAREPLQPEYVGGNGTVVSKAPSDSIAALPQNR
jgi:hypothetical protein